MFLIVRVLSSMGQLPTRMLLLPLLQVWLPEVTDGEVVLRTKV